MADNKTADIKMSTASKTRKSLNKLQKMKDEGEKICQVCPAELGPFFALAAEMVGCDIFRIPGMLMPRAGGTYSTDFDGEWFNSQMTVIKYREYSKIMHMNFYLPIQFYADKVDAVKYGAQLVFNGADSILPMGVTNEVLKYMSDNWVPTYGHIGAICGWQTNATGYKRLGKTAEEAFDIFKWGYEYQENGMGAMTIELTPQEVAQAISEKLRVPVIGIAAGAPCDGSEMVDMDTFGVMPKAASHAKTYAQLLPFLCEAYMDWLDDVRDGEYPEEKHGYHMDPEELEKFNAMMDAFEG